MTQKTKDMLLAQLSQLSRKVERAGRAGRRHSFTALTQQLLLVQHFVDDNLPRHLRPAYDELLGGMATALSALPQQPSPEERQQTVQLLGELMGYLQKRTEELRTGKKLIVFLPYKASMWDSLESIWQAASQDKEHCEAIVMPIPYCDLTPEGKPKEWHYEGGLFPPYVPITDYNSVDLAKLQPDVIFIHNPYDAYNRVTSIDSRFYSDKLKQYTGSLVYVPYFVTGGKTVADHFCQTPGVLYADHVICESEAIKEIYERNYRTFAPVPENKFLALGSPKYDKVSKEERAIFAVPESWRKIIGKRKVVLYNTSLSAQLANQSCILPKLRHVLSLFKQQKDVVLWWRPHPLMEATFDSMMPDMAKAYKDIKNKYVLEGWGIYDDTAELSRAIANSDIYYGDQSSVVSLYKKTKKPIVIEDFLNIPYPDGSLPEVLLVWPSAFLVSDDTVWIVHGKTNLLFRYNQKENRLEDVMRIPSEEMVKDFPYEAMSFYENKLYLLPRTETKIVVYDIVSNNFCTIELPSTEKKDISFVFVDAHEYEGTIYCVPSTYPFVLKLNTNTNCLTKTVNVHEAFKVDGREIYAVRASCSYENRFFCVAKTNQLFIYNMLDDSYEILSVGRVDSEYADISIHKSIAYLYDIKHHEILAYDVMGMKTAFVVAVSEFVTNIDCLANNRILLLSYNTDYYAEMNPFAGTVRKIPQPEFRRGALGSCHRSNVVKTFNETTYIYDIRNCSLKTIDGAGRCKEYEIKINSSIRKKLDVLFRPENVGCFGAEYGDDIPKRLSDYINVTERRSKKIIEVSSTGEKIYKEIINNEL